MSQTGRRMALDGVTCILISFEGWARGGSEGVELFFFACPCFDLCKDHLLTVKMCVMASALELGVMCECGVEWMGGGCGSNGRGVAIPTDR